MMYKNMRKLLKKISNYLILIFVTGIVLYFSLKDNYKETLEILKSVNKVWILVAIFLVASYWFFKAISLNKIIKKFKNEFGFRKTFSFILKINFFNAITPFASGGQPYELYYLKKEKIKMADVTTIVIQKFVIYQIALVLLGILAIIFNHMFQIFKSNDLLKQLVTIGFVVNFFVTVILFVLAFTKKINKFVINIVIKVMFKLKIVKDCKEKINKFNNYINDIYLGTKKLLENKREFIGLICLNLMSLICLYLVPLALLYSTGDYTSYNGLIAIVSSAYVMLIGSFVPIPGGSGGLEFGFLKFYGSFVKGGTLTAIMIMWRFVTYYIPMIIGAIALNIKGKKEKICE